MLLLWKVSVNFSKNLTMCSKMDILGVVDFAMGVPTGLGTGQIYMSVALNPHIAA